MRRRSDRLPEPGPTAWSVTVTPPVAGGAAWRARLLAAARKELEQRLAADPQAAGFTWGNALFSVAMQRQSGTWQPGAEIRLHCPDALPARDGGRQDGAGAAPFVTRTVPDERLAELGERLVGLEAIEHDLLVRLRCAWDGYLQEWSARTGTPLSAALTTHLEERVPLFVLAGDPGVGKSALVQAVADRYCRARSVEGQIVWLGTAARGNGLVGDFGQQVRAAFETARARAARGPCFLVIDEADALAMRRSESHSHQEDRAGTATLLQCLDGLRGGDRLAVFLTTNLLGTLDAAVLRRATGHEIGRPDGAARRRLLERWLPAVTGKTLTQAVQAANGMTPADMERALTRACLEAVREENALTPERVIGHLRRHERTRSV